MAHSSDTESHADVKPGKRNYGIVLTNLFKKKSDKNGDGDGGAQATGEKKDGTGDEEAARSETTVVIEDETPKKVCERPAVQWMAKIEINQKIQIKSIHIAIMCWRQCIFARALTTPHITILLLSLY